MAACLAFSVAIGDEPPRLTVVNLTPHRLNIVVAEKTFRNVWPGKKATYTPSGGDTVSVSVSATYSPGQGVEGGAERQFVFAPYASASTATTSTGWWLACSFGAPIVAPARYYPMQWDVTADTLAVR